MKKAVIALALASLTGLPVAAAPWGFDYAMATMIAYGGSDADGYLSVECSDPATEALHAGMMSISITPAASSPPIGKIKSVVFDIDGASLELTGDRDGDSFVVHDDDLSPAARRDLLAMLSTGTEAVISAGRDGAPEIARVSLEGSAEQLDGFEVCIPPLGD